MARRDRPPEFAANNLPASTYNNQWSFAFNPAGQIVQQTRNNDKIQQAVHQSEIRHGSAVKPWLR